MACTEVKRTTVDWKILHTGQTDNYDGNGSDNGDNEFEKFAGHKCVNIKSLLKK